MTTIHVACAATGSYVPHTATMLVSLLSHEHGCKVCVHFLHDADFSDVQRQQTKLLLKRFDAELNCIQADKFLPAGLPIIPRFSPAAWFRLLLPDFLPQCNRVIYLDSDMVVLDSLLPVWETELDGHPLAAVSDASKRALRMARTLSLAHDCHYFNSGVMLMDLACMRAEGIPAQLMDLAQANPELVFFADQDPLNRLLHKRRVVLPLRYNLQATCIVDGPRAWSLPDKEVRTAVAHPAVVHFNDHWKPWHYRCKHPLRGLYAEYRSKTPWPGFELEGRTPKDVLLRLLPGRWAERLSQLRQGILEF